MEDVYVMARPLGRKEARRLSIRSGEPESPSEQDYFFSEAVLVEGER